VGVVGGVVVGVVGVAAVAVVVVITVAVTVINLQNTYKNEVVHKKTVTC
jgi:hypothetical protein